MHVEAAEPSNRITKAQYRVMVKRLSYTFRNHFDIGRHGPNKDVVLCMTSGQVLSGSIFLGIIGAGGVFSAASTAFTVPELVRQMKQGGATMMVISEEFRDVAMMAAKQSGVPAERVLLLQSDGGARILTDLTGRGRNYLDERKELAWERITDPKVLQESLICLLYSSGTTGVPKGKSIFYGKLRASIVEGPATNAELSIVTITLLKVFNSYSQVLGVKLSHCNLVYGGAIQHLQDEEHDAKLRRSDPTYSFSYSQVAHLPTAHIAGVGLYFVNAALAGGPVYWMKKFEFPNFLEYHRRYRTTCLFTVPPIWLLIAKSPLVEDQFKYIQKGISGAAPLGYELQVQAGERLGHELTQVWGLTETTGQITRIPYGRSGQRGSVGLVMPNHQIRIVNENGNDVNDGEEGELLAKGPLVTLGYHKNPRATEDAFTRDGWFKSGDIGVCKNGHFSIVDRKKELIKYKGLQVAPAELEALLLSHNLILDAAVIGVSDPDGSGNELPRAYVVADEDKISSQEIKAYVKENMALHKQLRGGVIYVEAIPKSPSGKILRRELRDVAQKSSGESKAKL